MLIYWWEDLTVNFQIKSMALRKTEPMVLKKKETRSPWLRSVTVKSGFVYFYCFAAELYTLTASAWSRGTQPSSSTLVQLVSIMAYSALNRGPPDTTCNNNTFSIKSEPPGLFPFLPAEIELTRGVAARPGSFASRSISGGILVKSCVWVTHWPWEYSVLWT